MELEKIAIPIVGGLKSDDLPAPETYTYWKDRTNRTFYIDYEIDDDYSLLELAKVIIQMNIEEKDVRTEADKTIHPFIWWLPRTGKLLLRLDPGKQNPSNYNCYGRCNVCRFLDFPVWT